MARQMKESGIDWVGKIPVDWEMSKVGFFYNIQLGKMLQSTQQSEEETLEPYLCATNVGGNLFKLSPIKEMWFTPEEKQQYSIRNGDLLVVEGGDIASCDIISECTTKLYFQNALHRVRAKQGSDNRFLKYWLWFVKNAGYIDLICNKATIAHFSKEKFSSLPYAVTDNKNTIISDFLDQQCIVLDSVITKTKETIEEYKKLKQSIIAEAVTKGIRDNRQMKPSGVDWIGKLPADWKVQRGKRLFVETNERSIDGHEELLTVSHITGVTPRSMKNVNMFMAESLVDYKVCHIGDLAANTMWMWQGAIGVSKYEGVISPSYNTYRQRNNSYYYGYLEYLLRIPNLVATYAAYSTGITASRLRLYPDQFFSIMFPVPTMSEQKEIADYLDKKCAEIDTLISKKVALLEELENYKKSLIYEYVTGKKEVQ